MPTGLTQMRIGRLKQPAKTVGNIERTNLGNIVRILASTLKAFY